MSKKDKAEKRKAKLKARKQQIVLSEQSLSARLSWLPGTENLFQRRFSTLN